MRKFAIMTLQRRAGRSTEAAWITWDGMVWDEEFQCVFVEVPQSKTSKCKLVLFGAGRDRHGCWFLDLGDYLVMQTNVAIYDPFSANWLYPELHKTKFPGTTIGKFIKDLLPVDRGGSKRYEAVALSELPVGANAGMHVCHIFVAQNEVSVGRCHHM